MALLTFQILEGMERGRVLRDLRTPVSIGREEENSVQLNDERVSRFHAKVQEDSNRVILTDLESTNGTRVNGHPVQMHVLQIGDQVSIGRCVLLYGSSEEIDERVRIRMKTRPWTTGDETGAVHASRTGAEDGELIDDLPVMFPDGLPELPDGLRPVQIALMVDVLAHLHDRVRSVVAAGGSVPGPQEDQPFFRIDWAAWQRLLQVEMDMARCMRKLTGSDSQDEGVTM